MVVTPVPVGPTYYLRLVLCNQQLRQSRKLFWNGAARAFSEGRGTPWTQRKYCSLPGPQVASARVVFPQGRFTHGGTRGFRIWDWRKVKKAQGTTVVYYFGSKLLVAILSSRLGIPPVQ
jgi:hypothetical protein